MKPLFVVLCLSIFLFGCSPDSSNPEPSFYTIAMPVSDVDVPQEFTYGQTHTVSVMYRVPNTCFSFNTMVIEGEDNEKTVTVINTVLTNVLCEPYDNVISEASFDLRINSYEDYVFRFWKGKNVNGEDDYYVVEVPVRR